MDLLKLKIESPFRNLEGLEVSFNERVNTYVFIGNNGSGKSSVLEALSSIFSVLYYGEERDFEFSFTLGYSINGEKVNLHYDKNTLKLTIKLKNKPSDWNELRRKYLPSRVICNYSGEDTRMAELFYHKAYRQYIEAMKLGNDVNASLKMVLVDKNYWQIIFLVMLACRDSVDSFNQFIQETIGLQHVDRIILEAKEDLLKAWGDNTITYNFRQLLSRRDEGHNLVENLLNQDNALTPLTLFLTLVSVKELITNLSITYNNGINVSFLSEGEKKMMVVLFILEALADENSLVLLDEPDSHIHVARKSELVKFLSQTSNRENLLTSHSPTLTSQFDLKSVRMLDRQSDGKVTVVNMSKQEIVSQLTQDIWTLQEQQIFLASNDDILLVEGKTDEIYLKKALEYFHTVKNCYTNLKFAYLPCNGASGILSLRGRFAPKKGQMMIALFDNDKAGWDGINKLFGRSEADENLFKSEDFHRARKLDEMWVAPYPKVRRISGEFNIEDYFRRKTFTKFVLKFKTLNEVMGKDALKKKFETACLDLTIKGDDYQDFAAVFELIEKIKDAENLGKDKI